MAFTSFIDRFRGRVIDAVGAKMARAGERAEVVARELVHKDTHQTEKSIGSYWDKETMTLVLFAGTSWAGFLEKRYPYLRPALAEVAKEFGGGGLNFEAQFTGVPEKYHGGLRKDLNEGGTHRVIIGHRARRARPRGR
jgi:hypothetical protein